MRSLYLVFFAIFSAGASGAEPLETTTAQYREVDATYSAEAVVEAVKQSTVSAQISGRVKEINFDVGDYVKKGQVIVRIDEAETAQALSEAKAVLAQTEADFENARATYQRTRQLFERKFVSQAALDKAQAEYQAAKARVDARRAAVGIAANTRSFAAVIAPYSGVVAARQVELGEMAFPGKPLMTGFDPSRLRVVASIPQYKLGQIKGKPAAVVEFPSLSKFVRAIGVTVQPSADPRSHASRVRLDLPPDLKDVYPGMFARAHFVIGRASKLVIPYSAVLRRSELTAVYVVDTQGRLQLRQIRLGEAPGQGEVEVLTGLTAGEKIALDPVKAGIQSTAVSAQLSAVSNK